PSCSGVASIGTVTGMPAMVGASSPPALAGFRPWGPSLQVQPGPAGHPLGGHGVDVALAEDQVVLPLNLDLVAVLGVEQHLVTLLYGPDVGARGHHLGPRQPARDLGGGRDQDAGAGLALPLAARDLHEYPVGEHLDALLGRTIHRSQGSDVG